MTDEINGRMSLTPHADTAAAMMAEVKRRMGLGLILNGQEGTATRIVYAMLEAYTTSMMHELDRGSDRDHIVRAFIPAVANVVIGVARTLVPDPKAAQDLIGDMLNAIKHDVKSRASIPSTLGEEIVRKVQQ